MAQQFQVPQFIGHEAKLIGPFTLKQSGVLGGVGAILFVLWFMVEKFLFFPLAFLVVAAAVLVVFVKINGRPLLDLFLAFFSFFTSPQLYIWQKRKERRKKNEKFMKKGASEEESQELTKKEILSMIKKLKDLPNESR